MSMHFPALTLLTNTGTPASVGKRQEGKGMHWAGGDVSAPSFLNGKAAGQTLDSSTFLVHIIPH